MPTPQNLKPGIKLGPDPVAIRSLIDSRAQYAEVWYRVDQESSYQPLFHELETRGVQAGLHFWGKLEHDLLPNLAYPDPKIWQPSLDLMKQCVDVAEKHHFYYVNVHLGNASLEEINLDQHWMKHLDGTEIEPKKAEETFEKNITTLDAYTQSAGIQLIVEGIPPLDPKDWVNLTEARLTPHKTYALSNVFLEQMARKHAIAVNNDISHTAAELQTSDRAELWSYLLARSTALAPFTKLVHCNTLIEPFNGTDSHDGILDADFAHNVFPTKSQLSELLKLLVGPNDVWIVCEPRDQHTENYRALVELLSELP